MKYRDEINKAIEMYQNVICAMDTHLSAGYTYKPLIETKKLAVDYMKYLYSLVEKDYELTEHEHNEFQYLDTKNYIKQGDYMIELLKMDLPQEFINKLGFNNKEEIEKYIENLDSYLSGCNFDLSILEKIKNEDIK